MLLRINLVCSDRSRRSFEGSPQRQSSATKDCDWTDREIEESFKLFDRNGDGAITTDELATVMKTLGQTASDAELKELIKDIDKDGNGSIDLYEFKRMMKSIFSEQDSSQNLRETFKEYDMSDNGFITFDELKYMMRRLGDPASDTEILEMIEDVSSDGIVDFEKFCMVMKEC
uniref:Calmodulin n=1 Tax=Lampea lactea TaxID=1403706 RepID=V9PPL1_9METZ|nr:calmodulin [Lampea lactea]